METNANGSRIVRNRAKSILARDYEPTLPGGEWRSFEGGNAYSAAWYNNMQNQIRVFRAGEVSVISAETDAMFYKELGEMQVVECTEHGSKIEREFVGFSYPDQYEPLLPEGNWFKLPGGRQHSRAWANESLLQVQIFLEGDVTKITAQTKETWVLETAVKWII
ncbi:MAG: hypothetical protein PHT38_02515 [Halothiobacillus sp.]|jgi:hypothetical protein|nr:hypothetical protein [Halothiobacillus sp.]